MIVKKSKILKISLLLLTSLIATNANKCYAAKISFGTIGEGSNNVPSDTPYKEWASVDHGKKKYEYRYKEWISTNTSVEMDAYNYKGESVMSPSVTITEEPSYKEVFRSFSLALIISSVIISSISF